jgi:hypothetical protein
MLSKAEVAELARDCGLGQWADDLVSIVSLGWALTASGAPSAASGSSKIGGLPDLAPGEEWPFNRRGIPMTLMAQIDLSCLERPTQDWTLDDASWSPPRGLMRVFADLVDRPNDLSRAVVLLSPPGLPLRAATLPDLPDPWPEGGPSDWLAHEDRYRSFPEIPVRLSPFLSAPEIHAGIRSRVWDTSPGAPHAYQCWFDRLRVGDDGADVSHALLGHVRSPHDDVRGAASLNFEDFMTVDDSEDLSVEAAWRPLLSLFDDDAHGMNIADGGLLVVLAPASDLRVGRFDRLICDPESS